MVFNNVREVLPTRICLWTLGTALFQNSLHPLERVPAGVPTGDLAGVPALEPPQVEFSADDLAGAPILELVVARFPAELLALHFGFPSCLRAYASLLGPVRVPQGLVRVPHMNTKGALRKILSNLHPNTILKPNLDSNTQPQPSAYSYPYT